MPEAVLSTFGSRFVDAAVAVGLASVLTGVLYVIGRSRDKLDHFALVTGLVYALACLVVYFVPRFLVDSFATGVFSPTYLVWLSVFVSPLMVAQGAVPTYLFTNRGYAGALVGLLAATAVTFWVLLALEGESDVLVAYPTVVTPIAITLVGLGVVGEIGVRAVSESLGR